MADKKTAPTTKKLPDPVTVTGTAYDDVQPETDKKTTHASASHKHKTKTPKTKPAQDDKVLPMPVIFGDDTKDDPDEADTKPISTSTDSKPSFVWLIKILCPSGDQRGSRP